MKLHQSLAAARKHHRRGHLDASSTRRSDRRHRHCPLFEPLEVRLAPAVINWMNPAGGDWDTGANWSGGVVPGASDQAEINEPGAVTITHSKNTTDHVESVSAIDPITLSGGSLTVTGAFGDSSAVTLSGGTLSGATVPAGTSMSGNGTLTGVTLAGTVNDSAGGTLTITDGLTLSNGVVELGQSASLDFAGTQTFGGTGDVKFTDNFFDGTSLGETGANDVLTVGAGVTVLALPGSGSTAAMGTIADENTGSSIVLDGTVSAAASGATILIDGGDGGGTWTNLGTIESVSGGTLVLGQPSTPNTWSNSGTITATGATVDLGGTFSTAALGTFDRSGGTVYLTGTLNNSGATLALSSATGSWQLDGGTISGGTITTAGGVMLGESGGTTSSLIGVTLAGTLQENGGSVAITNGLSLNSGQVELASDASLNFNGTQTLGGMGDLLFSDTSSPTINVGGNGNVLTIGPNITVHGNSGEIDGGSSSFINEGTINADTGAGELVVSGNFSNSGALNATNGSTLLLGSAGHGTAGIFTNSGTITGVSGQVWIIETLNNAGSTLALNAATGSYQLVGGTILGGTVTTTGAAALFATQYNSTLAGVTLAGSLNLSDTDGAIVTVTGGLTLSQGSVIMGDNPALSGATLTFQGTQTLAGTGTVTLSNLFPSGGLVVPSGSTLTIAPGITVQGNSGMVGSSTGGQLVNHGTIMATGSGMLTAQGDTNYAAGTLTGGTWEAVGGSTLLLVGAAITTNAANILLDGASSQIDSDTSGTNALAPFATNAAAGRFTIQNGADFTTAQAFTNAGTLTINSGSTFSAGGTGQYTQTGGTTILNAGTLGTTGNQIKIQGGTLSGPGTVTGSLSNAGEVDLGSNPGTLAVSGNYTQTSTGVLTIQVGGATAGSLFDQVNISGTATLGGTLTATLINGYAPGNDEHYDVLNFASSTGSFATFDSPQINGSPAFATEATPSSFELIGATTTPDLAVSRIAFTPGNASQDQDVSVTFTVTNLGTVATTAGSWTDSVYLSTEGVVDGNAFLLGRVTHTGNLASQADYSATLTAAVPGLSAGSYHVIVVVDSGLQVPDTNRADTIGVAPTELSTQPPTLTIGTELSGTIASGQDLYYRLNVTPGTNVKVGATFAVAVESDLYLKFGALPTANSFDQSSTNLSDLQPELVLPSGQGGAYYIWLHGGAGAAAGVPFTLVANLMAFQANSFTPSSASNQGQVTMDLTGSGFTAQTTVSLQGNGGQNVKAQTVTLTNANELNATFDLTGKAPGR